MNMNVNGAQLLIQIRIHIRKNKVWNNGFGWLHLRYLPFNED